MGARRFPAPPVLTSLSSSAAQNPDCTDITNNPGCLKLPLLRPPLGSAQRPLPADNPGSNALVPKCGAGAPPGCVRLATPTPRDPSITTITDLAFQQHSLTDTAVVVHGNHSHSFVGFKYRNLAGSYSNWTGWGDDEAFTGPHRLDGLNVNGYEVNGLRSWGDLNGDGSLDAVEGLDYNNFNNVGMLSQNSPGCVPGLRLLMNDHPVLPSGQVGKPTFTSTYIHPDDPDT